VHVAKKKTSKCVNLEFYLNPVALEIVELLKNVHLPMYDEPTTTVLYNGRERGLVLKIDEFSVSNTWGPALPLETRNYYLFFAGQRVTDKAIVLQWWGPDAHPPKVKDIPDSAWATSHEFPSAEMAAAFIVQSLRKAVKLIKKARVVFEVINS
jgi:hypothetical protein